MVLACSSRTQPVSKANHVATVVASQDPDSVFTAIWDAEGGVEHAIGNSRAEVVQHLGQPDSATAWLIDSSAGWPDLDSGFRWTYPNYVLAFVTTKDHRDILGELTLLGDRDTLPRGIHVGMAVKDLLVALTSTPDSSTRGDTTVFHLHSVDAPDEARVDFVGVRGVLRAVSFKPWID